MDKAGMPMYPAIVLGVLTLLTWAVAVAASYVDERPAEPAWPGGKNGTRASS